MMQPHINLHIEELALYGFSAREAESIRSAVIGELTRLLNGQQLPAQWQGELHVPRIQADNLVIHLNAGAALIGAGIAGSVFKSLSGIAPATNLKSTAPPARSPAQSKVAGENSSVS